MKVTAHSLDQDTIDIIKRTAAEHKSNDSAALRFIVSDWNRARQAQNDDILESAGVKVVDAADLSCGYRATAAGRAAVEEGGKQ
jgi:hypothetical protein